MIFKLHPLARFRGAYFKYSFHLKKEQVVWTLNTDHTSGFGINYDSALKSHLILHLSGMHLVLSLWQNGRVSKTARHATKSLEPAFSANFGSYWPYCPYRFRILALGKSLQVPSFLASFSVFSIKHQKHVLFLLWPFTFPRVNIPPELQGCWSRNCVMSSILSKGLSWGLSSSFGGKYIWNVNPSKALYIVIDFEAFDPLICS